MLRSPRALALRAIAIAIAALTARTVAIDLHSIDQQAHSLGPLRHVVTARHTLREGHIVGLGDLRLLDRHVSQEPSSALTSLDSAVGHAVTVDVAQGAPLLRANVSASSEVGTSGALPPDRRAVRIVDAAGLVPDAGAIVDLYATLDDGSGTSSSPSARLVARGARVLRVDRQSSDVPTARATSSTTGVLVMVKAAEMPDVASAVANGAVTVAIAPVEDACCADP